MKIKSFFFLFLIIPSSALIAGTRMCNNLKEELLAIEYKLQTDTLYTCGSKEAKAMDSDTCCNPKDPDSCLTRKDAEANYNSILSKLTLAKGIQAVGMALEGHHNTFTDLKEERLDEAISASEKLDLSVTKADLIYSMLEFKDGTNVFSDFNNYLNSESSDVDTTEDEILQMYLRDKCGRSSTSPFKQLRFCKKYLSLADHSTDSDKKRKEFLEIKNSLAGFIASDNFVINDDRQRQRRFEDYQKKLLVHVKDGEFTTPGEFINSPEMVKVRELQKALEDLKKAKLAGKPSSTLVTKVLDLSSQVKKINVNYQIAVQEDGSPVIAGDEMSTFINENLQKVLSQVDIGSLVTDKHLLDQFDIMTKKLDTTVDRQASLFNNRLKTLLKGKKGEMVGGRSIASFCGDTFDENCLRTVCQNNKDYCPGGQAAGLNDLYSQLQQHDKQREGHSLLKKAKLCLSDNKELKDKQECLNQLSDLKSENIESDIGRLKRDLEKAKKKLTYIEFGQPFETYNNQKALVLNAYRANKCIVSPDSKVNVNGNAPSFQCSPLKTANIDNEVLTIAEDGEAIGITLAKQNMEKLFKHKDAKLSLEEYKEELKLECSKNELVNITIKKTCDYYNSTYDQFKKNYQTVKARQKTRYKTKKFTDRYTEADNLGFWDAAKTTGKMFLQNGGVAQIGAAFGRVAQTDQWAYYMKQQIQSYNTWYMNKLTATRTYLSNLKNTDFTSVSSFSNLGLYGYNYTGN